MTKDERAALKAADEYAEAIKEYGLDDIQDGWGQTRARYMMDAFFSGFYAGRDYEKENKT